MSFKPTFSTCTNKTQGCGGECFFKGVKVGSRGPGDSPFVIIGESPGSLELAKGAPFVGPSGELLETTLREMGYDSLTDPEPYITNAFKCLPRQKDVPKTAEAVRRCRDATLAEVGAHPRKVILALGGPALWSLTGNYNLKVTNERGKVFDSPFAEKGIVASVHPAFLLRGGGNLMQFQQDIKYALSLLREGDRKDPGTTFWEMYDTPEKVAELAALLRTRDVVAADIETSGFSPWRDRILSIGIAWRPNFVAVVPGELITPGLFENGAKWCWHNGKFDIKFLRRAGCTSARVDDDTMLMSYALNEKRGIHDLEQVSSDWLGAPDYKHMLKPYLPKKDSSYELVPPKVLAHYLALDVRNTFRLREILRMKVSEDPHSEKLYQELLIPASEYLAQLETEGIPVDVEWVERNIARMTAEAQSYEDELSYINMQHLGVTLNPRSPLQIKRLLYETLKLGPTSLSTDEDTLKQLPQIPAVKALLAYRKVHKGLSTYARPALDHLESDGCIHATYLIHGTATGRLASRNPNVQNIPRQPLLRGQFICKPGEIFIEPDLSQAELRSLACLSGDPELIAIFSATDRSLHDEVATEFFGPDFDEEQKMIAKNVNFGIVYGITPFGLLDQLVNNGIESSHAECAMYIHKWLVRFPKAAQYIQRCGDAVRECKTIVTCFGRKKRHGVVTRERLKDLENEAKNFPHQSIASDITLSTGIRIRPQIRERWGAIICNTVHDSILIRLPFRGFDAPNEVSKLRECTQFIISELQRTPLLYGLTRVPFKAEAKIGFRWGSAKAAKREPLLKDGEWGFLKEWDPSKELPSF
jgi:DNA polymerase-1